MRHQSNSRILRRKADLAVTDLAAGGKLNPEQAKLFFRKMIASPTLLNMARIVPMTGPQREINKIGFGTRILRASASATAMADADRVAPDLGKLTLTTSKCKAEIHMPYDVLEDNIEGQSMMTTVMDLITGRASLDVEELIFQGDKNSSDAYLAQMDGVLLLESNASVPHIVNAAGQPLTPRVFTDSIKALPVQYQNPRNALRFLIPFDQEAEYRYNQAQRIGAYGDGMLTGDAPVFAIGVPVAPAAMIPGTNGFLTNPKNIIVGFQRDVTIEVDKDIRAQVWWIVLSLRLALAIEEDNAAVLIENLAAA